MRAASVSNLPAQLGADQRALTGPQPARNTAGSSPVLLTSPQEASPLVRAMGESSKTAPRDCSGFAQGRLQSRAQAALTQRVHNWSVDTDDGVLACAARTRFPVPGHVQR